MRRSARANIVCYDLCMDAANFRYTHPRGEIYGYISDVGLCSLMLPHANGTSKRPYLLHDAPNRLIGRQLAQALERYFAGMREDFSAIPLDLGKGSAFQRQVWLAAREVPHGITSTYGTLAETVGVGKAGSRAVGAALGANPVAILVPCHRFIAANGKLVNFAAGLEWKRELLALEGALLA